MVRVTLSLPLDVLTTLRCVAKADNRTMSGYITAHVQQLKEYKPSQSPVERVAITKSNVMPTTQSVVETDALKNEVVTKWQTGIPKHLKQG